MLHTWMYTSLPTFTYIFSNFYWNFKLSYLNFLNKRLQWAWAPKAFFGVDSVYLVFTLFQFAISHFFLPFTRWNVDCFLFHQYLNFHVICRVYITNLCDAIFDPKVKNSYSTPSFGCNRMWYRHHGNFSLPQ
jgi:hypothetical protein